MNFNFKSLKQLGKAVKDLLTINTFVSGELP